MSHVTPAQIETEIDVAFRALKLYERPCDAAALAIAASVVKDTLVSHGVDLGDWLQRLATVIEVQPRINPHITEEHAHCFLAVFQLVFGRQIETNKQTGERVVISIAVH